jgi:hypothetical protein
MRGGLVDDAGQCTKLLGAGGYSRVIQRICHFGFSFGWDFMGETIGEARSSCQQVLSLPNTPSDYFGKHPPGSTLCILRGWRIPIFSRKSKMVDVGYWHLADPGSHRRMSAFGGKADVTELKLDQRLTNDTQQLNKNKRLRT